MSVTLEPGDCLDVLLEMAAAGALFDAVVTDPPYDLVSVVKRFGGPNAAPAQQGKDGLFARQSRGFMGKAWDGTGIAFRPDTWRLVYDVMKPGAHLLAFGGSRTYHRMACAIEDAGFEVRDCILWLYGTGFPKSHDVAKSIDKAARGVPHGGADPTSTNHGKFKSGCSDDNPEGRGFGAGPGRFMAEAGDTTERELVPEAAAWQGWGTALKPAFEPIIVARKPLDGTVAANVLAHGTGALNIDACRIPAPPGDRTEYGVSGDEGMPSANAVCYGERGRVAYARPAEGRWPANVCHDGSDEVLDAFAAYGERDLRRTIRSGGGSGGVWSPAQGKRPVGADYGDTGTAARFFYSAKATAADRANSKHPTVKPLALMRYLVTLVTPPGGTVLDPFSGSGTTLQAAAECRFNAVGIERDPEYQADILRRIAALELRELCA